jgi:hypothetical protein
MWEDLDAQLVQIRQEIEAGAGYCNKTGFEIIFADGQTYTGRYDVIRREIPNLRQHVRDFVGGTTGLALPAHMDVEAHERYINFVGIEVEAAYYFLAREYAVGVKTPEDRAPEPVAMLTAETAHLNQRVEVWQHPNVQPAPYQGERGQVRELYISGTEPFARPWATVALDGYAERVCIPLAHLVEEMSE